MSSSLQKKYKYESAPNFQIDYKNLNEVSIIH